MTKRLQMNKTLSNKQNKHAFKKTKGLQINKVRSYEQKAFKLTKETH